MVKKQHQPPDEPWSAPESGPVRAPALVAWGAVDHTLPVWAADAYAKILPRARTHVSPRGTHTWVVSRAEEFAAAVEAFLDSEAYFATSSSRCRACL